MTTRPVLQWGGGDEEQPALRQCDRCARDAPQGVRVAGAHAAELGVRPRGVCLGNAAPASPSGQGGLRNWAEGGGPVCSRQGTATLKDRQ